MGVKRKEALNPMSGVYLMNWMEIIVLQSFEHCSTLEPS